MTPLVESDRFCVNWLEDYFDKFGDKAPNDTEVSLNMGTIKSQYQDIFLVDANFHFNNDLGKVVSFQRFTELWRVVYPTSVNRPIR